MSEWKEYKLEEIAEILDFKRVPLSSMERANRKGQYPYYGASGIIDYLNGYIFEGEHVLISEDGENLRSRQTPIAFLADGRFWVNNHAHIVKSDYIHNRLICYSFANTDLNPYITGAVQPKLSQDSLKRIPLFLPESLEERKEIVSILTSLDDKIDLLRRENATLEAMAETLFRELVSDKENNGTLEQIMSIQNGYAFKSKDFKDAGTHKVIKIKNISDSIVNIDTTDYVDNNAIIGLSSKFKISSGDILIAMTGAEIGKLGIIPKNNKSLWLNQRVGLLVEKFKGSKYLAYLQLKSDFGQDYIENTATGSAQPNISGIGIEKCGFPIFKQEDLIQISLQIGELYDKIIFNLGQIYLLKDTRDFLLPKLMSNEISIS